MGGRRRRGPAADPKQTERAAIMSLALAQLPADQEAELRRIWADERYGAEIPDLAGALGDLATLTIDHKRISQRTFSLQLLAKIAQHRGTSGLVAAQDSLRTFAESAVVEDRYLQEVRSRQKAEAAAELARDELESAAEVQLATADLEAFEVAMASDEGPAEPAPASAFAVPGPPLVDPQAAPEVQGVYDGLNNAAVTSPESQTAWQAFTSGQSSIVLTAEEQNLPQCTDDQHVVIGGEDSWRVVTWFCTSKPAADFAHWTDARRWHLDCNLFYESVTPAQPSAIAVGAEEYSAPFIEVVRFSPTKTLVTPLTFTRTVRPPHLYALHFTLTDPQGTADIAVDSGSLVARHDPDLPPDVATRITAEKCIRFRDPAMASWPTLCCDLFWTELTMTVALGCAQDSY